MVHAILVLSTYALLVIAIAGDPVAAAYANAGTLVQAREELEAYRVLASERAWIDCEALAQERHWDFGVYLSCARVPDSTALAVVRRRGRAGAAEAWFARAVERAPGNSAAHERLGGLALSRGDFERGLAELRAAYAAGARWPATRLLLADAYLAMGDIDRGIELARGVEGAGEYFAHIAWSRYWARGDWSRAAGSLAVAGALVPECTDWARQARLASAAANFYYIFNKY